MTAKKTKLTCVYSLLLVVAVEAASLHPQPKDTYIKEDVSHSETEPYRQAFKSEV